MFCGQPAFASASERSGTSAACRCFVHVCQVLSHYRLFLPRCSTIQTPIPCALWHISAFATEKIDVAELSNIKLHPLFGLPTTRPVKFLLHLGNNGSPCCIGVDASDKDVSVFAGEQKWHLSSSEFSDLIAECTDRATLATFAVSEVKVEKDSSVLAAIDRADAWLDLQAGADHVAGPMVLDPSSPVESDDAGNASSSADDFSLPAPAMIVDDAGEVFFPRRYSDQLEAGAREPHGRGQSTQGSEAKRNVSLLFLSISFF